MSDNKVWHKILGWQIGETGFYLVSYSSNFQTKLKEPRKLYVKIIKKNDKSLRHTIWTPWEHSIDISRTFKCKILPNSDGYEGEVLVQECLLHEDDRE